MEQPGTANKPQDDRVAPISKDAFASIDQSTTQGTPNLTGNGTEASTVAAPQPKAKTGKRVIWAALAALLVAGAAFGAYLVLQQTSSKDTKAATVNTQQTQTSTTSQTGDTSTTSLNSDLKSIDNDINSSASDQSSADDALSDASNQITIPTE